MTSWHNYTHERRKRARTQENGKRWQRRLTCSAWLMTKHAFLWKIQTEGTRDGWIWWPEAERKFLKWYFNFCGKYLTFCGRHLTFCGRHLTFCGRHLTFCGNNGARVRLKDYITRQCLLGRTRERRLTNVTTSRRRLSNLFFKTKEETFLFYDRRRHMERAHTYGHEAKRRTAGTDDQKPNENFWNDT